MASPQSPLPQPSFAWVDAGSGRPTLVFSLYMASLDAAVRGLAAGVVGPLVNAANDAAAAAAGVQINGLYHNAGAVRIRLT